MIKAALFDGKPGAKTVEFHCIPIDREEDLHCVPAGCVSFAAARQISQELARGAVSGFVAGHRWYRQTGGANADQS